ncbi:putative bifunctional diguanylate cyclase/phosphodiesterase [Sphingomonas sp. MMS24-J13]|uniref:putative bifunctional diguanylate cyclase/phosphodiesterase n=1 Tax=Sphingomonas sp. MMS24-J13 TaxID=3238686 RepID=UPI00384D632A
MAHGTSTQLNYQILASSEGESRAELLREALDNMPHGVVMFDAACRLVVSNKRYIEMYGLSSDVVRPGCTLKELIEHRERAGLLAGDVAQYRTSIIDAIRRGHISSQYIETADRRTIHIFNQPIPSGGWVATHEDVTEQKAAEAWIEHLAHYDALTDLPNRTLFKVRLDQALQMAMRDRQVAVLFLDIDNFKNINDNLGYSIGDELIRAVAGRLRACIESTDIGARLGGDEFVVIQTQVERPGQAAGLAAHIREALTKPYVLDSGHHVTIDTSIGIALAPDDGASGDQLLRNAEIALYGAKSSGRGVYRFFERAMDERMKERRKLEIELRQALKAGEFEIYYQPIINVEFSTIQSFEALLRWRHPERGIIAPGSFIAAAEEIGILGHIGEWVIRTACREAMTWPDDIAVAVNVSPTQLRNDKFVDIVINALAESGLAAERLEVEITESVLLDYTDETLTTLHRLRRIGVRIAMDDFGTGYSSLNYLNKFPFDKIKIDQSFIKDLSDAEESTAIVRAVTGLAKAFHMVTTAEGVETVQQAAIVTALGCTEMQGYLFSKPCTAGEAAILLLGPMRVRPAWPVSGLAANG